MQVQNYSTNQTSFRNMRFTPQALNRISECSTEQLTKIAKMNDAAKTGNLAEIDIKIFNDYVRGLSAKITAPKHFNTKMIEEDKRNSRNSVDIFFEKCLQVAKTMGEKYNILKTLDNNMPKQ